MMEFELALLEYVPMLVVLGERARPREAHAVAAGHLGGNLGNSASFGAVAND